jgi:beta-lactamase class D
MNRVINFRRVTLIGLSCLVVTLLPLIQPALSLPKLTVESLPAVSLAQNVNLRRHFQELNVEGSIMVYDANNDRIFQHNPPRNQTAFLPASTFKILNSLIALDTGVISDEQAILTWDGIPRKVPAWNRDLNMREAIKLSAVWFYQVLARRVGYERMQKWVTQVGYGNQTIGSRNDIDKFWLQGDLRITPQQQIQFLRRFYKNDLPFSARALAIVKDIMIMEKTPGYTITGKTGWVGFTDDTEPKIGWYVGYVEKGKNVYFFATNIDIRNEKDPTARLELTHRCLKDLAIL